MATQKFSLEIDRGNMSAEDFSQIKNKVVADVLLEGFGGRPIEIEFDKHVKVKVKAHGVGGYTLDPAGFDVESPNIFRAIVDAKAVDKL